MKRPLLISACLTGTPCRFDGTSRAIGRLSELSEKFDLIPLCPEVAGGLGVPREPCELVAGLAKTKDGADRTFFYKKVAQRALERAQCRGCRLALLKERSPSCGKNSVYDGTFSKKLIPGAGITTHLLTMHGIKVFSEEETDLLLSE